MVTPVSGAGSTAARDCGSAGDSGRIVIVFTTISVGAGVELADSPHRARKSAGRSREIWRTTTDVAGAGVTGAVVGGRIKATMTKSIKGTQLDKIMWRCRLLTLKTNSLH